MSMEQHYNETMFGDWRNGIMEKHYNEQWLGGFFDAEGYIGVTPTPRKDHRIRYTLIPCCHINQAYVAGYFDGEGCVAPAIRQSKTINIGYTVQPNARIRSKDNDVLDEIHDYLDGFGITSRIYVLPPKYEGVHSMKDLVIYGLANTENFLLLISPYLHSSKHEQAKIMLSEILPRMKRKEHLTKSGFLKVIEHVDELNSLKNGVRGKYNSEFFKKIWFEDVKNV